MEAVVDNIRIIESTFREVQSNLSSDTTLPSIAKLVNSYPSVFRSVAYEAASMHLALRGIKLNGELDEWSEFLEAYAANHKTQYNIGLGWALAQEQMDPKSYCYRWGNYVADGFGYYEGMFRKRKVVYQKVLPDWKDKDMINSYMRGVGRSIWYISLASYPSAEETISTFPDNYKADLWYGLGVAVAYVGIADDKIRQNLKENDYWGSIKQGVLQAVQTGRTAERGAYLDTWQAFAL